jgi:pre-mRNA-processing factor SLU7
MSTPSHVTESMGDRKKTRELAEARQSGAVAPAVDVKTGSMINPHNPEFITKRPWYLGADTGPSLDHQADQRLDKDRIELSMASADFVLREERRKLKQQQQQAQFEVGMWVEALKNNKGAYRICQIIKIAKKGKEFDLKYEDGTLELKVKLKKHSLTKPRIRITKKGSRTTTLDASIYGKETFDSKRDKYHGYEPETHTKRVEQVFNEREDIRKQMREKSKKDSKDDDATNNNGNSKDATRQNNDSDSDSDLDSDVGSDSDDEFVQRDEDDRVITSRLARQGGVGGAQMKVTARNLRIREDTAKYLRNLDPNSAYYDPKSRSMRDNPNPEIAADESLFVGDNFARISGDAVQLADTQLFAWDATDKGINEIHPQANPSQAELLKKKFKSKSANLKLEKKKAVLDKYGGAEYLDGSGGLASALETENAKDQSATAKERKIRFGVSTTVEEYSRDGRLLKGPAGKAQKLVPLKSKYEEDVFMNGHTTVWGSYFHVGAFQWGYTDDHSMIRNSYCTGENGRKANDEANEMRFGTGIAGSAELAQARGMLKAMRPSGKGKSNTAMAKLYGEADPSTADVMDKEKLKDALKRVDTSTKEQDERKRKYNSMNADSNNVTAEDMEAYRLRKERGSDPMDKISSGELLDYSK